MLSKSVRALTTGLCLFACTARADTFDGEVVRIVDGDSLLVMSGGQRIRVRLKEIDAPELKQPFGRQARESLVQICAKKEAKVLWTEIDRNGRTLGRVLCGATDANAEQVRRGMAWVFDRYVRDRSLYTLQESAQAARLGLWADQAPVPPWEWRQSRGMLEYRAPK